MRHCALIRFDFDRMPVDYHSKYPFTRDDVFVFLGEIAQMPGHCVVARQKDGMVFVGHDMSDFIELTDEEA